jgi:hypothetical protein
LQYQADRTALSVNQLAPRFRLINQSGVSINLADYAIRYWFSADGNTGHAYSLWWSNLANYSGLITSKFTAFNKPNADQYLELGFRSGSLANTGQIEISGGINNGTWSNYSQSNDYSFNGLATSFVDSSKVALYYKGILVSGTAP